MEEHFSALTRRQTMVLLSAVTFGGPEGVEALEHLPADEAEVLRYRAERLLEIPREKRIPVLVQELKRLVTSQRGQLWGADPEVLARLLQQERPSLVDLILRALPQALGDAVRNHLPPLTVRRAREPRPEVLALVRWKLEELLQKASSGTLWKFSDVLLLRPREIYTLTERQGVRALGVAFAALSLPERQAAFDKLPPDLRQMAVKATDAARGRALRPDDARALLDQHGFDQPAEAIRSAGIQRLARACLAQQNDFAARLQEKHRPPFATNFGRWLSDPRTKANAQGDAGRAEIVAELERLEARGLVERPARMPLLQKRPALPPPPAAVGNRERAARGEANAPPPRPAGGPVVAPRAPRRPSSFPPSSEVEPPPAGDRPGGRGAASASAEEEWSLPPLGRPSQEVESVPPAPAASSGAVAEWDAPPGPAPAVYKRGGRPSASAPQPPAAQAPPSAPPRRGTGGEDRPATPDRAFAPGEQFLEPQEKTLPGFSPAQPRAERSSPRPRAVSDGSALPPVIAPRPPGGSRPAAPVVESRREPALERASSPAEPRRDPVAERAARRAGAAPSQRPPPPVPSHELPPPAERATRASGGFPSERPPAGRRPGPPTREPLPPPVPAEPSTEAGVAVTSPVDRLALEARLADSQERKTAAVLVAPPRLHSGTVPAVPGSKEKVQVHRSKRPTPPPAPAERVESTQISAPPQPPEPRKATKVDADGSRIIRGYQRSAQGDTGRRSVERGEQEVSRTDVAPSRREPRIVSSLTSDRIPAQAGSQPSSDATTGRRAVVRPPPRPGRGPKGRSG